MSNYYRGMMAPNFNRLLEAISRNLLAQEPTLESIVVPKNADLKDMWWRFPGRVPTEPRLVRIIDAEKDDLLSIIRDLVEKLRETD